MDTSSDSNTFFQDASNPKLDEIKKLLEKDSSTSKLDGMKRTIAMISKGRNVSSLFPHVVKNVVCADIHVKQLVYMYLIHYAEFEQDLALLSINTFQKDLDNPNAFIRAQALRVLSSIRLRAIAHILVLSVKRCVGDNSPYVRKSAAHAIPKIYSLDHSLKEELVDCIETLFGDNSTLVLGSAVATFAEVCPERIDLIHPHFRKFCNMIADIDEWGQIALINVLARYARTQFANPDGEVKIGKAKKKSSSFYSDSDSGSDSESESIGDPQEMDPDHRLFLRSMNPLVHSRNSGVVVAVAMAYYYCAPHSEMGKIGKALVRIVRNTPQIAYIVLSNILTISQTYPDIFGAYLTEFFIYDNDTQYVQELKLDILTNIATESNISKILREFNVYVRKENKAFVTATIQAIGKCAIRLPEVQESCMHGLMPLITNRSETVVAESVIVIKQLLQLSSMDDTHIISHLAKLLDKISVPNARASIIWVVGEYCTKIPLLAPDILRTLANSFKQESKIAKLQILTMATKLLLSLPQDAQVLTLLFQYICNMAKFDLNYDVRDRARLIRSIFVNPNSPLFTNAKTLFCSSKPAPGDESSSVTGNFALNSLSHIVKHTAFGYLRIADWPSEIPDPSTRNQVARKQRRDIFGVPGVNTSKELTSTTKGFYSGSESEGSEYSDYSSDYSDSYSDSWSSSEDQPSTKKSSKKPSTPAPSTPSSKKPAPPPKKQPKLDKYGYPISDSESSSDYSDDSEDEQPQKQSQNQLPRASSSTQTNADSFFGFSSPSPSPVTSNVPLQTSQSGFGSIGGDLLSLDFGGGGSGDSSSVQNSSISFGNSSAGSLVSFGEPSRPRRELLKQVVGNGLKVEYLFLRRSSIHGAGFSPVQLWFTNNSGSSLHNVGVKVGNLEGGAQVIPFEEINIIPPNSQAEALLNVKFTPSTPIAFRVVHQSGSFPVELLAPAGELLNPSNVPAGQFSALQKKLGGLQEVSGNVNVSGLDRIGEKIIAVANVTVVTHDVVSGLFQFSAKTLGDGKDLLISVESQNGKTKLRVNCENAIFANSLYRELKQGLEQ